MATGFADLLHSDLVFFGWEAGSMEAFFGRLKVELEKRSYIKNTWYDAILTREQKYPTGLACSELSVAIPHTDPEHLAKPYIAVVKPKTPIVFQAMAGIGDPVPAELIVNLGLQRNNGQVEALQKLMELFMDHDATHELMSQTNGQGVVATLAKYLS